MNSSCSGLGTLEQQVSFRKMKDKVSDNQVTPAKSKRHAQTAVRPSRTLQPCQLSS